MVLTKTNKTTIRIDSIVASIATSPSLYYAPHKILSGSFYSSNTRYFSITSPIIAYKAILVISTITRSIKYNLTLLDYKNKYIFFYIIMNL